MRNRPRVIPYLTCITLNRLEYLRSEVPVSDDAGVPRRYHSDFTRKSNELLVYRPERVCFVMVASMEVRSEQSRVHSIAQHGIMADTDDSTAASTVWDDKHPIAFVRASGIDHYRILCLDKSRPHARMSPGSTHPSRPDLHTPIESSSMQLLRQRHYMILQVMITAETTSQVRTSEGCWRRCTLPSRPRSWRFLCGQEVIWSALQSTYLLENCLRTGER